MKVKCFDFEHELDLEEAINKFLETGIEVTQILFSTSHFYALNAQVFSFSAMIIYN